MRKRVTAYKARTNFGEILNDILYRGATYVVTRRGKTVAIVSPFSLPSGPREPARAWRRMVLSLAGALKGKDGAIIARVVRQSRRERPDALVDLDA